MGLNAEALSFAVPSSMYLCELQPKAEVSPVLTMRTEQTPVPAVPFPNTGEEHTHQKPPGWLRAV